MIGKYEKLPVFLFPEINLHFLRFQSFFQPILYLFTVVARNITFYFKLHYFSLLSLEAATL